MCLIHMLWVSINDTDDGKSHKVLTFLGHMGIWIEAKVKAFGDLL